MKLVQLRRPEVRWLVLGLVLLFGLGVWASWTVWSKYRQAVDRLADLEPRYARLSGLTQSSAQLTQADEMLTANMADFVYSAQDDASQTGNMALQRARELATARGLRVASSQAAAAREEQGFDRIGLNLRVDGEWPQLVAFLRDLAEQKPLLHQTSLQLGSSFRGPRAGESVFAILELYVLKERKP